MKWVIEGKPINGYVARLPFRLVLALCLFGELFYLRAQFPLGLYVSRSWIDEADDGKVYLAEWAFACGACKGMVAAAKPVVEVVEE